MTLIGKNNFRVHVFYVLCDSIVQDLRRRVSAYEEITSSFSCFFTSDSDEIKKSINILRGKYKQDIENGDNLEDEFYHFMELSQNLGKSTITEMFETVQQVKATFPNILTLLEIYFTIPVSNASGERSFSVLKRIKNYLRSRMSADKLDALSLLCIESGDLKQLDCEEIIKMFAKENSRKKLL